MEYKSILSKNKILLVSILLVFQLVNAEALTITSVDSSTLHPGQTTDLIVHIENDEGPDLEDVSFSLDLTNLPLSTIGSSQRIIEDLESDDNGKFSFVIRSFPDAKPGEYNLPYILTYKGNTVPFKGTIGIKLVGSTILDFSPSVENPIVGQKGRINFRIINKGDGKASFVSLKIVPQGFTLLSEDNAYIGDIDADDFESASFDVIFNSNKARLVGFFTYKDFENQLQEEEIDFPLTIYTRDQAIQKGIIQKNNTGLYIIVGVIIIILWIIWRTIAKRRRMKKRTDPA